MDIPHTPGVTWPWHVAVARGRTWPWRVAFSYHVVVACQVVVFELVGMRAAFDDSHLDTSHRAARLRYVRHYFAFDLMGTRPDSRTPSLVGRPWPMLRARLTAYTAVYLRKQPHIRTHTRAHTHMRPRLLLLSPYTSHCLLSWGTVKPLAQASALAPPLQARCRSSCSSTWAARPYLSPRSGGFRTYVAASHPAASTLHRAGPPPPCIGLGRATL